MKGNIKKLSVLVGVPVIALLVMVVLASAGPAIPYGIKGVYAVTGFSSCDPVSPGIMEGKYTFRNDGTGSFSGFGRNIGGIQGHSDAALMFDFSYTVTKEGKIEFEYSNLTGGVKVGYVGEDGVFHPIMQMDAGPSHGYISPDDKTITISCGPPIILTVIASYGGPPIGTEMYCITSLAGMRIK